MKSETVQAALVRAQSGQSLMNYQTIISGFIEKGIPPDQITPRENVLTYNAWLALGRQVRKGEHGVKVITFIPMSKIVHGEAGDKVESWRSPRSTTVFHISQTDAIGGKNG